MRQLEGVCSSKIYHCHLSEVYCYYCIVVRRELLGKVEGEDGQGVGLASLGEQGWLGAGGRLLGLLFSFEFLGRGEVLLVKVLCEAFKLRVLLSFLFLQL